MQCANTDCSTELLYLRSGSIQLIETKARLNVAWSGLSPVKTTCPKSILENDCASSNAAVREMF